LARQDLEGHQTIEAQTGAPAMEAADNLEAVAMLADREGGLPLLAM